MSGAVQPEHGALHAELSVLNPWHDAGPPTLADLVITLADVSPHGRPLRIAWVHERADNPGVSITNAAEKIHNVLQQIAGPCAVVEHYDDESYAGRCRREGGESFDLVTVDDAGVFAWRHLGSNPHDVVAALIIEAAQHD